MWAKRFFWHSKQVEFSFGHSRFEIKRVQRSVLTFAEECSDVYNIGVDISDSICDLLSPFTACVVAVCWGLTVILRFTEPLGSIEKLLATGKFELSICICVEKGSLVSEAFWECARNSE